MITRKEIKIGDKFGMLTLMSTALRQENGSTDNKCLFKCDCKAIKYIVKRDVMRTRQPTLSCGCLKLKHGLAAKGSQDSYLIYWWRELKKRCLDPVYRSYKRYGGIGIKLFKAWINDCAKFSRWILKNLGRRPEGFTLGRIDRKKNYVPGNLKWIKKNEIPPSELSIKHRTKALRVIQCSLDDIHIRTFPSISAAIRSLPLKTSTTRFAEIARSPNNQTQGYIWKIISDQS
jgi:hypothetical protein